MKHMLPECRSFKKLAVNDKGKLVLDKQLCCLCLGSSHTTVDCPKKATWKECDVQGCGGWHSRMLHGAKVPGLVLAMAGSVNISGSSVLLLIQTVQVEGGGSCVTLWDHGSTTALVTFKFAEQQRISRHKLQLRTHRGRRKKE